ncbi:hypothetical protein [Limosilactobacillus oris]|uniref:hypothetical protein n=1 Tax=Limosilactobacillus oris TaxID=1632 RepID=UPI002658D7C5|nr:hypothetical protein [Limosilactobacillus oris]
MTKAPSDSGIILPYKVGDSYYYHLDSHVMVKQTVIDRQGNIRAIAYYDGQPIGNATKYLGTTSGVNDTMPFMAHRKSYSFTNRVTSTNNGLVYYYAKKGSEDQSEVRFHYIVVEPTTTGTDDEYVYLFKKTDADKNPLKQGDPVKVVDPSSLTDTEKNDVKDAIKDANPNAPIKDITVNNDGSATVTFNDGSTTTLPANVAKKTASDQYNPQAPDTKVPVTDPSHLTNGEKTTVTDAITNNPQGTVITVSDDGTVTITYSDGSHDTILETDVVTKTTDSSTTN